jgi:hypothetical protein
VFALSVLGALVLGASPIFVRLSDLGLPATAFWHIVLARHATSVDTA